MTREQAILAGIMNATSITLNAIVRHLDAKGILAKSQFADELERAVQEAEKDQPASPEAPRLDFLMMRNLAALLRDPRPEPWAPPWKPVVIEGGRPPSDTDDDSSR